MKKVIIIDDSLLQLNLLKTLFEKNMWEVTIVKNSLEVYKLIYQTAPDLIVTDVIMPHMGGFELVKLIKNDEKISKIPIVIYSILEKNILNIYLKKYNISYFYSKDTVSGEELVIEADKIIKKRPISSNYKENILDYYTINFQDKDFNLEENDPEIEKKLEEEKILKEKEKERNKNLLLDRFDKLKKLKNNIYQNLDNKDILGEFLNYLGKIINYNLAIVSIYENEEKNSLSYFDIKDIILNPIFQGKLTKEEKTNETFIQKKYSPNLKTIYSLDDFLFKDSLEIKYLDKTISQIKFYSIEDDFYKTIEEYNLNIKKDEINEIISEFMKARYIKKNSYKNKNNDYFKNSKIERLENELELQNKKTTYLAIIHISNYDELQNELNNSEFDILNIKITQKIKDYLSDEEKIIKENDNEYILIIFEQNYETAIERLKNISNYINNISYEDSSPKVSLGVANCYIDNDFNILEARKIAREVINKIEEENK